MDDAPLQMLLGQFTHIQQHILSKFLKEIDLNGCQAGILFFVGKYGQMSQKELAEKLSLKPPSITAALRKLEQRKLVEKKTDQEDQRSVRICLLPAGEECIAYAREVLEKLDTIMYDGICMEEKLLFRRILLQMRNNLLQGYRCEDMEDWMKKMKKV